MVDQISLSGWEKGDYLERFAGLCTTRQLADGGVSIPPRSAIWRLNIAGWCHRNRRKYCENAGNMMVWRGNERKNMKNMGKCRKIAVNGGKSLGKCRKIAWKVQEMWWNSEKILWTCRKCDGTARKYRENVGNVMVGRGNERKSIGKCRKIECRKDDGMETKWEEKYGKM